ncbi:hypothetical protein SAMN02746065_1389 [Desulfocicer vacuolatum DSM 3385]|uniref:ThiS family protein n=1 Tax=Desulfocicer vacuolatum DSM 3385 TaxID=1121400 RepID=A0A1W2EPY6_9BACT|nr:hypothetical protein [Desulfocicer vacuolatum]SMD11774.1 hypothetical protein SAMN02746065_1389 [Desulfocicer vacuolatum DSM 3385]
MNVTVVFHGPLSGWLGVERASFKLCEGALLTDLLTEIAGRFRQRMPGPLWKDKENKFNDRVLAYTGRQQIKRPETLLADKQEITFYLMVAGG